MWPEQRKHQVQRPPDERNLGMFDEEQGGQITGEERVRRKVVVDQVRDTEKGQVMVGLVSHCE